MSVNVIDPQLARELVIFLNEARQSTYASGKKAEIDNEGFKVFVYGRGPWRYRDRYAGSRLSGGQEIIWYEDKPFWYMNYGGGMMEKFSHDRAFCKQTTNFLKSVLMKNESENFIPRGRPSSLEISNCRFDYSCAGDGTVVAFYGIESIHCNNQRVFHHKFHGGLLA